MASPQSENPTNTKLGFVLSGKEPTGNEKAMWLPRFLLPFLLSLAFFISGCGKGETEVAPYDNTAEVEQYYLDHPDRFTRSSIEALPDNLDWQDGSELTPYGDPRAQRGGHLRQRLASMQPTLRIVGPDANGSLRGPLWGANSIPLISYHPWETGYIPGIARRWAIDPEDSRRMYFELDPEARWSDGRPVTVDDIFFSAYFLLSEHIQDPAINRVLDENIDNITRFDDYHFALTLKKPTPEPLAFASTFILCQREFYREFGPDYTDRYHWRFAPVTGPYVVDEDSLQPGRRITFKRLEEWWANEKPFYRHRYNVDRMTYVLIRDDFKAFESFLNGEIDLHGLNRTELWYDRAEADVFKKGYIERAWAYDLIPAARSGIYMNAMYPRLDNPDIRKGIQHSINYERVSREIFRGDQRRVRAFADGYGRYDHPTLRARPFSIEDAHRHFAKAGYIERGPDGILVDAEGTRLSFSLTISNQTQTVSEATVLKEEAKKVGLELAIEQLDPVSFATKLFEKKHQMAISAWSTGFSVLPAFEWEMRGEDAGKPKNFNTTNIKDPELDALLAKWDTLDDPDEAERVSHAIQQKIHDFAAWVPGLTQGYLRMGYWRWLQWPDYFQVPRYFFFIESGVFWIDEDRKQETLEARKSGQAFEPVTRVYERWKLK
jgi:microcin C transport system substrate-binding protein